MIWLDLFFQFLILCGMMPPSKEWNWLVLSSSASAFWSFCFPKIGLMPCTDSSGIPPFTIGSWTYAIFVLLIIRYSRRHKNENEGVKKGPPDLRTGHIGSRLRSPSGRVRWNCWCFMKRKKEFNACFLLIVLNHFLNQAGKTLKSNDIRRSRPLLSLSDTNFGT